MNYLRDPDPCAVLNVPQSHAVNNRPRDCRSVRLTRATAILFWLVGQFAIGQCWAQIPKPAQSAFIAPAVSYFGQPIPFKVVGINPGKIEVGYIGVSNRLLRVTFNTLLTDRKMTAMVQYHAGSAVTNTISSIDCGTYPQPVNLQSCDIRLDNLHSSDTHITVHLSSQNISTPMTEARFDVPVVIVWPRVPLSAKGVSREHGIRDDKRDPLILLDVQPRELRYLTRTGTRTVTVQFWTRFPNTQVSTALGIITKVNGNGGVQNSRQDRPTGGNCNRVFASPGLHSCELAIDMGFASMSAEPMFVFVGVRNERYYARVQVTNGMVQQKPLNKAPQNVQGSKVPGSVPPQQIEQRKALVQPATQPAQSK
jgi:hypothetical protein